MQKKILQIGICISILVSLCVFSSGCMEEKKYKEETAKTGELEILDSHMDTEYDALGLCWVYVRGHAKNIGEKQLSYASVDVKFYDTNGTVVGTGSDSINDLDPGEIWNFEVTYYDEHEEVTSYKIAVGTCW